MRKILIEDIAQISDEIIDLNADDEKTIVIVGYYETIADIFNIFMKYTNYEFEFGELHPVEYDGYDDAWYAELSENKISLGRARWDDNDKYIMFDFDRAYVEEDFLNEFLESNNINNVTVFGFEDVHPRNDSEDSNICIDDDDLGFCFCLSGNNEHVKFKYRGTEKLNRDMISDIIHEYVM